MPAISAAHQRAKAIRTLLSCTVLWGLSFPVMKALALAQQSLLPDASSWFFTALGVMYRFGAAGVILSVIYFRELKTISRREVEQGMLIAIFGAGGILFQMDGIGYTAASTCAFLTQGYCVFIPLWVALTHRRWPPLKIFLSTALVVGGAAVLSRLNFHDLKLGRGELETLVASLLFTGQILCLENPRYAGNRPGNFSAVMFLVMALLCVPLAWGTAPNAQAFLRAYASPATCVFLAMLVVFCTLMAYVMMNRWQKFVTATEAGLIYCIEPVIASFLSLSLPAVFSTWADIHYANEQLTGRLFVGGGLITAANLLLQSRWLEPKPKPA
ncbi:MAG: DMT family transporter [Verrucomicrobiota bacterium]